MLLGIQVQTIKFLDKNTMISRKEMIHHSRNLSTLFFEHLDLTICSVSPIKASSFRTLQFYFLKPLVENLHIFDIPYQFCTFECRAKIARNQSDRITLLPQKQLIYARPYSPPDTARLRICTTLSWPVYSSSQYAGPYSPPHTAIQLFRDLPCLGTWIARTIELNGGTSHSHATCKRPCPI